MRGVISAEISAARCPSRGGGQLIGQATDGRMAFRRRSCSARAPSAILAARREGSLHCMMHPSPPTETMLHRGGGMVGKGEVGFIQENMGRRSCAVEDRGGNVKEAKEGQTNIVIPTPTPTSLKPSRTCCSRR